MTPGQRDNAQSHINPQDPQAAHRLSRGTQAIGGRTKQSRAGLALPARTIPARTPRPVPRAKLRTGRTPPIRPRRKTAPGAMRTGRTRMVRMVVPNRSPRARKVPAPRAGRERPRTRRAQTSPKTRVPPAHPVNRRAAKTARARTRRTGPTRRAARLPTTSARLARPNPRQIRKHRDPQRREINRPRVTRPTHRRATIRRATRPIGRAAAPKVKIPPRKARNKAGASRTTHKELRGRTSRGRPGLTNRPMVRRNPG